MIVHKCDTCKRDEASPITIPDWEAERGPTHEYQSERVDICGVCALRMVQEACADKRIDMWAIFNRLRGGGK